MTNDQRLYILALLFESVAVIARNKTPNQIETLVAIHNSCSIIIEKMVK